MKLEDKHLHQSFELLRNDIDDNGFSKEIMRKLPIQKKNNWARNIIINSAIIMSVILLSYNFPKLINDFESVNITQTFMQCFSLGIAVLALIYVATDSDVNFENWK